MNFWPGYSERKSRAANWLELVRRIFCFLSLVNQQLNLGGAYGGKKNGPVLDRISDLASDLIVSVVGTSLG